jgi:hypothetical protein
MVETSNKTSMTVEKSNKTSMTVETSNKTSMTVEKSNKTSMTVEMLHPTIKNGVMIEKAMVVMEKVLGIIEMNLDILIEKKIRKNGIDPDQSLTTTNVATKMMTAAMTETPDSVMTTAMCMIEEAQTMIEECQKKNGVDIAEVLNEAIAEALDTAIAEVLNEAIAEAQPESIVMNLANTNTEKIRDEDATKTPIKASWVIKTDGTDPDLKVDENAMAIHIMEVVTKVLAAAV